MHKFPDQAGREHMFIYIFFLNILEGMLLHCLFLAKQNIDHFFF